LEAERDEAKTLLREGLVSAARACEHVEAEQDDEIARRVALEQDRSDWRERAIRLRAALTRVDSACEALSDEDAAFIRAALAGEENP
jgi:hypothetical protein